MNETNSIVKKSNDLIDKARYELTLTQQRLILYTVAHINVSDEDFKDYDIPVAELIEKTGSSHWLYHELKREAEGLLKKPFFIETEDGGWFGTNWFSGLRYLPGQGIVRVHFDPFLKPYLLKLKERFTMYMLKYVLPIRSSYSVRIYELLKQHENFGKRYFDLQEFKTLLMIENKPSFKQYGHIKFCILKPARKEINEHTDLEVDSNIEEKKLSRKVIGFTIRFKKQTVNSEPLQEQPVPQQEQPQSQPVSQPEQLNARLDTLFLNVPEKYRTPSVKNKISDYLYKDDEYIILNIEYVLSKPFKDFLGYLARALEKDYAKDRREQEKLAREKELQQVKEKQEQELEKIEAEQKDNTWWKQRVDQELAVMSEEVKEEIWNSIRGMASSLSQETQQNIFRSKVKANLESQGIKPPEKIEDKKCQLFESLSQEEKQKYLEKAKEFLKKEYQEANFYENNAVLIEQKAIDLFNQEKIAQDIKPPDTL